MVTNQSKNESVTKYNTTLTNSYQFMQNEENIYTIGFALGITKYILFENNKNDNYLGSASACFYGWFNGLFLTTLSVFFPQKIRFSIILFDISFIGAKLWQFKNKKQKSKIINSDQNNVDDKSMASCPKYINE